MAIDSETSRLMQNWALWQSGASISCAVSGAYDAALKDAYDTPMPLINGEAIEVNQAVEAMAPHLAKAVREYWCKPASAHVVAMSCSCSIAALYRRLDQAHARVHDHRRVLKDRAARVRSALSHSHG